VVSIVRLYFFNAKVAVAVRAWLIVSSQVVCVPLHAPDQPVNVEVDDGSAVNVTVAL
jgi:hypothetical protein